MSKRRRGRPVVGDAVASATVHFRLTALERAQLRQLADQNHMTVTAVLREAIAEFSSDCCERPMFTRQSDSSRLTRRG